jgi:hypothetical protein
MAGREREGSDDRCRESNSGIADGAGTEPDSSDESPLADTETQRVLEKLKKARAMARRAAELAQKGGSEEDDG